MIQVGQILKHRYRIEQSLGGGGTATVFRALDLTTGTPVAIKALRPQFARVAATRHRFLREAAIVQRLDHPGIVKVLDADQEDESPFLVLELVLGETLRQLIDRSRGIGHEPARRIGMVLAELLAHAHGRGVLHRDLKPDNIFIAGPPYENPQQLQSDPGLPARVRLTDFGQARVTVLASLTGASFAWGTPEYMAPEVFARGRIDLRSDLYSLGVVLFELTTGRLPWSRAEVLTRLGPAARNSAIPPSGGGRSFDSVLERLLARSPMNRPESAREAWLALDRPSAHPGEVVGRCRACGAAADRELPVCLECGHVPARFAHTRDGSWRLLLRSLPDDAATIGRLLDLAGAVARPLDRPLQFLTGDLDLYSKDERAMAIQLPAVLFSELDEGTARGLERLFQGADLDVLAARGGPVSLAIPWGRAAWIKSILATAAGASVVSSIFPGGFVLGGLIAAGAWVVGMGIWAGRQSLRVRTQPGTFSLSGLATTVPAADALLAESVAALRTLQSPDARGLLSEVITALYRLSQRLGQVTGTGAGVDPTGAHALPARLLADAPILLARVAALGKRLAAIDDALANGSEAESMQELARIERRVAKLDQGAPDPEAMQTLAQTRRRIEETLDRRHQIEVERDELTTSLCALLGQLRDAAREIDDQLTGTRALIQARPDSALAGLQTFIASAG